MDCDPCSSLDAGDARGQPEDEGENVVLRGREVAYPR